MAPDEEESSVESLSKLSVKFPPTDSDSAFLQSTPDTPPISCGVGSECLLPDPQFDSELGDLAVNFNKPTRHLFEECSADPFTPVGRHLLVASKAKPPSHTSVLLQSPVDKVPGFKAPFLNNFGAFPSLEANERTANTSQQVSSFLFFTYYLSVHSKMDCNQVHLLNLTHTLFVTLLGILTQSIRQIITTVMQVVYSFAWA